MAIEFNENRQPVNNSESNEAMDSVDRNLSEHFPFLLIFLCVKIILCQSMEGPNINTKVIEICVRYFYFLLLLSFYTVYWF